MNNKTKVIFRFWKISNEVIAIFPEEPGNTNPMTCSSYEHIGQHGACNPYGIIQESRLATPEEYKDLKEELESIGYDLTIIKRHRYHHLEKRREIIVSGGLS